MLSAPFCHHQLVLHLLFFSSALNFFSSFQISHSQSLQKEGWVDPWILEACPNLCPVSNRRLFLFALIHSRTTTIATTVNAAISDNLYYLLSAGDSWPRASDPIDGNQLFHPLITSK